MNSGYPKEWLEQHTMCKESPLGQGPQNPKHYYKGAAGQVATARCYHCHKLKTPALVLGEMETEKLEMERLRKVTGMEN